MLRGVSGILKFYGVDLESREKSRPLITRSRVNSHEGGPTAIKLEKLATLLFQRVKKDRRRGREEVDDWIYTSRRLTTVLGHPEKGE